MISSLMSLVFIRRFDFGFRIGPILVDFRVEGAVLKFKFFSQRATLIHPSHNCF